MQNNYFADSFLIRALIQYHQDIAYYASVTEAKNNVVLSPQVKLIILEGAEILRQDIMQSGFFDPKRLFQENADQAYIYQIQAELQRSNQWFRDNGHKYVPEIEQILKKPTGWSRKKE